MQIYIPAAELMMSPAAAAAAAVSMSATPMATVPMVVMPIIEVALRTKPIAAIPARTDPNEGIRIPVIVIISIIINGYYTDANTDVCFLDQVFSASRSAQRNGCNCNYKIVFHNSPRS